MTCLYLRGNFISRVHALEVHRENITFVHADLPTELYVIVSVVQMFLLPHIWTQNNSSPSGFAFSVSLLVF